MFAGSAPLKSKKAERSSVWQRSYALTVTAELTFSVLKHTLPLTVGAQRGLEPELVHAPS